jgi:hypothetical protein
METASIRQLSDTRNCRIYPGSLKSRKFIPLLVDGSIHGSPGELYRGALAQAGSQWGSRWRRNARRLRLIPRDHYFPGRSKIRTVGKAASFRCDLIGAARVRVGGIASALVIRLWDQ